VTVSLSIVLIELIKLLCRITYLSIQNVLDGIFIHMHITRYRYKPWVGHN